MHLTWLYVELLSLIAFAQIRIVTAQQATPILQVYLPEVSIEPQQTILGSIVNVDFTGATLALNCNVKPVFPGYVCGDTNSGVTITSKTTTSASSSNSATATYDGRYNGARIQQSWRCEVFPRSALCTTGFTFENSSMTSLTSTYTTPNSLTITATAGASKLSNTPTPASTSTVRSLGCITRPNLLSIGVLIIILIFVN